MRSNFQNALHKNCAKVQAKSSTRQHTSPSLHWKMKASNSGRVEMGGQALVSLLVWFCTRARTRSGNATLVPLLFITKASCLCRLPMGAASRQCNL